MKQSHLVRAFAIAISLWSLTGLAQAVPQQLSFTGNLTGSGGPATGPHNFIFTLYDAVTAGTVAWTETQNGLQVNSGLVFTTLGTTTPLNPTILNGAPLWLEVSVDGAGLSPRVPILSVPYAIRAGVAASAQTLGTLLPSDVQRRVAGTCSGASAVQSIDAAGAVACITIPGAGVTNVTASAPLASSGGATPNLSIATASASASGALSSADWTAFSGKVSSVTASAPLTSSGGINPVISLGVVGVANGGTGTSGTLQGVVLGGNPLTAVASTAGGQVLRRNVGNTAYEFIAPAPSGDPLGANRSVLTGPSLTGGGNLTADRTLSINLANPNTWTGTQTLAVPAFTNLVNNVKMVRIRVDCPTAPCAIPVAQAAGPFAELRLTGPNEFSLVDLGSIVNFVAYANGVRIAGNINSAAACGAAPPLCVAGGNVNCCRFDTGPQSASAKDFRIIFGQPGSTSAGIQHTTEVSLLQDISGNGTRWGGSAITSQDQAGQ